MNAPDFLVIGAQKAGATWIYDCLNKHPEVFMPKAVELLYFNKSNYADPKLREAYFENFKDAEGFKRVGENTPSYLWTTDRKRSLTQPPKSFNSDIPAAVQDVLGDKVDMIASLRHPVWRAISAFRHHAMRDRIAPTMSLRQVAHSLGILDIGFYGAHLDTWLSSVGKKRLEVLIYEDDIVADPMEGFRKLCKFLNVDETFVPDGLRKASNTEIRRKMSLTGIAVSGHPLPIGPADIEFLIEAYVDDIARTKAILGKDLASWDEKTERLQEWCKSARSPKARKPEVSKESHPNPAIQRNRDFQDLGLNASPAVTSNLDRRFVFEPPSRLSNLSMRGDCSIGAFSYTVTGFAYGTHIGRYCSIARDVNIGQFNHPTTWLSTSPFQYEQGFTFATGAEFEHKAVYDATRPDPALSALARRELIRTTTIGNDVWIGHAAVIIAGVTVGDGAVIGANSVVTKNVEPYEIVGGTPAKHIRFRFTSHQRTRLLKLQWWKYATWQLVDVPFADIDAALTEIEKRVKAGMQPYVPGRVTNKEDSPVLEYP